MATETISLLKENRIMCLVKLQSEKISLLNNLNIAFAKRLPYHNIVKRIKEVNDSLLILREMPD